MDAFIKAKQIICVLPRPRSFPNQTRIRLKVVVLPRLRTGSSILNDVSVTFAKSQRGGQLIVYEGYSYSLQKLKDSLAQWRCTMVQPGTAKRCTAKLITDAEYKVLDYCGNHTHRKPRFIKRNNVLVRVY